MYAEVIGVGGDHVTNDIAIAFNLTNAQAEGLKCRYGSATLGTAADSRIEIPSPMPGGDVRSISRRALETVVNARMEEIMHIILESMNANGLLHHLNSGAVLTGGGASMKNLVRLAAETLGMRVRVPSALNVDGLEDAANPAAYATVAGMLIHSAKNEVRPEGLLTRLIRKFRK